MDRRPRCVDSRNISENYVSESGHFGAGDATNSHVSSCDSGWRLLPLNCSRRLSNLLPLAGNLNVHSERWYASSQLLACPDVNPRVRIRFDIAFALVEEAVRNAEDLSASIACEIVSSLDSWRGRGNFHLVRKDALVSRFDPHDHLERVFAKARRRFDTELPGSKICPAIGHILDKQVS